MIRSRTFSWLSKKQATLALSSTQEEYQGDANATIQKIWIHGILIEFGISTSPLVEIYCDNHINIKISSDPVQKQITKHIEVHMHYIHELVHEKSIT